MPYKRASVKRRFAARWRKPYAKSVNSTIVSSLEIAGNNVSSGKSFAYNVILPDVNAHRPIRITRIVIKPVIASGSHGVGAFVQGRLVGQPFTSASGGGVERAEGNSSMLVPVNIGRSATIILKPKLAAQKNWIEAQSTNTVLELFGWCTLPTQLGLSITTYYIYDNDNVVSTVA